MFFFSFIFIDFYSLFFLFFKVFKNGDNLEIPLKDRIKETKLNPHIFSDSLSLDFLMLDISSDLFEWELTQIQPLKDIDSYLSKHSNLEYREISVPYPDIKCIMQKKQKSETNQSQEPPSQNSLFTALDPLRNLPCLTFSDENWKYEYCHLRKIKQTSIENSVPPVSYNLGHYFPKRKDSSGFKFGRRAFVLEYSSGDRCDPYSNLERQTEVRFVCKNKNSKNDKAEILTVFEIGLCKYVILVHFPPLCENNLLDFPEEYVDQNLILCGNVDFSHNSGDYNINTQDITSIRTLWLTKVIDLLNTNPSHTLLARALLDIAEPNRLPDNLNNINNPFDMFNIFAIKALQKRIEDAVNDIKSSQNKLGGISRKRKLFITTYEDDKDDEKNIKKKKKRTFKIEL
jgi:hypothetical protein